MERMIEDRRIAAKLGFLLVVPGILMLAMLNLNIEPPFGPLEPYLRRTEGEGPHIVGSLIAFNAIVVFPVVALLLNFAPAMRGLRSGKGFLGNPTNLAVAAAASLVVLAFFGAIAVDQYPCWVGVPNCD
jgi:hypothetical protein